MPFEYRLIAKENKINLPGICRDAIKAELEKRGLLNDQ